MFQNLVTGDVFALAFVFARVGAVMMLLPGFGEVFVSARVRLVLAFAITIVITPAVNSSIPALPDGPMGMLTILGREMAIGLFLGGLTRIMIAALHTAGTIMGFQSSLANAQQFDPVNSTQGSLVGTFFNILGVFLIFMSDLHHMMLMAVADSYQVFQPGEPLPIGDFAETAIRTLSDSFLLAMQIASPLIVMGMLFYLGLGLLARLMPQVQVFFIAIPIQIGLAFMVMAVSLSAGMMWFLDSFQGKFQGILLAG
ncbi:MAG: flagellar type III secretion system protein FliR [Alphaproteobacteria bacterium]|nr:flagellar type III secretion system protein FliR [Alphaproteobacteria bacterium]